MFPLLPAHSLAFYQTSIKHTHRSVTDWVKVKNSAVSSDSSVSTKRSVGVFFADPKDQPLTASSVAANKEIQLEKLNGRHSGQAEIEFSPCLKKFHQDPFVYIPVEP